MNCRNIQPLLSAYVDCELTGEQMLEVRRHIADCPVCREEEAEMVLLKSMLSGTLMVEPPEGFEDRLIKAVFEDREEEPITMGQTISILSGVSLAAAALTLLMLNFMASPKPEQSKSNSSIALMTDDQASLSAADPFGGTPVVHTTYGGR